MSLAIIVHKETNNVDGGALKAVTGVENTFYARKLTHMLVNENENTVLAFRPYSESINPNQFDLSPGVYRISADIVACNYNNSGGTPPGAGMGLRCGLYNVSIGGFQKYFGSSTESIISMSTLIKSSPTGPGTFPETNGVTKLDGLFSVSSSINSFEIRMAVKSSSGTHTPTANDTLGDKSTVTVGTLPEYYTIIKILRLA